MRIHFISIGGSIMHNLAISLHKKGHEVSGSDDEIFEPARSRLKAHGLLPEAEGWDENRITKDLDVVVLGMHAKKDNPELKKALALGLNIQSFPEMVYENSKEKLRIGIAGSHGKTTITSMIMHVLSKVGLNFDYLVGAKLKGFEDSVKLSTDSKYLVLEADEYLSSPLDKRPKFLWYHPQIALISGIAWDHINVFPTFELYKEQFRKFIESLPEKSVLIYFAGDPVLAEIVNEFRGLTKLPYNYPEYSIRKGSFILEYLGRELELRLQGSHNLLNMEGARKVCEQLGITAEVFYSALQDFEGAGKRLELLYKSEDYMAFKDFAHSPSKVKATIDGIKEQYPDKKVIACLELHTYSSLNKDFLPHYKGTMDHADEALVYINPEAVELKRLDPISVQDVLEHFRNKSLKVFFDDKALKEAVEHIDWKQAVLLFMSSGNYNGWDLNEYFNKKK